MQLPIVIVYTNLRFVVSVEVAEPDLRDSFGHLIPEIGSANVEHVDVILNSMR